MKIFVDKAYKEQSRSAKQTALIFIVFSFFLFSCNPDPSEETLMSYSLRFENSSEDRFFPGEKVNVVVTAINNINPGESVKIEFSIINGGGTVSASSAITQDRKATNEWTLGNDSFKNTLRASIYSSSGEYITYADLTANCFIPDSWNEVTTEPDNHIMDLIADTVNNFTLMVTNNSVYRQVSRYYLWEKLSDPLLQSSRTIELDRNGIIYVSTWNGEIMRSDDHGSSWIRCTKPYTDNPYFINIYICNDNSLWVYKYEYPVKFSKNGGITWQTVPADLSSQGFGKIFRLKSGELIFHGSNCCSLNISSDDGLTWKHLQTPGYSTKIFVNDNDEIFLATQENGITIYESSDKGMNFNKIHSVRPEWGSTWDNNFYVRWKSFWYVAVPGFGLLRTNDFFHYENYWSNTNLLDLFIDHKGVMIVKDWRYNKVYYRKNSE